MNFKEGGFLSVHDAFAFLPSFLPLSHLPLAATHLTPSRPSVMRVPPRSPLPVPPGTLYLTRKLPSPLVSFWQNGILANVLSPPLTIFLGVRLGAARRESRDPKAQPGSLPVLDPWTQPKARDLQVLSRQNPTRQTQLRRFPGSPLGFSTACLLRLSTSVGWWFSMAICSVSPFLVSCLCSRFSLSGYHEVYTKHSIDKTVFFLLVSSKLKASF